MILSTVLPFLSIFPHLKANCWLQISPLLPCKPSWQIQRQAAAVCWAEAFPSTILTLGAGGRFDSHFWTQSGAPSPYLAFRAPPRFQAIYGVESVPRFQPIFGTQSAPPPAFKLYMVLKACPPRFQPIFGTQSAPRFQAIYVVESVPRFQPIFSIQSAPPLSSYILCWKRAQI